MRDWRGLAAVILATGLTACLFTAALALALNPNRQLTIEESSLIAGVLGGIVGALASYLGAGKRPPPEP